MMKSARVLLQALTQTPAKVELPLDNLSADQLTDIQELLKGIKKRKLNTEEQSQPTQQGVYDNAATSIANALAAVVATAAFQPLAQVEPSATICPLGATTEAIIAGQKDDVEWVSFVYSHNRTHKQYTVRANIQSVTIDEIDDQFKAENCIYPRANLPRDAYQGNRWTYETECNELGWKIAWLNSHEIAGKRGLIQRAVDSYRNRYPSMRSRRVARQEKLTKGTLRKRKGREPDETGLNDLVVSLGLPLSARETTQVPETTVTKPPHLPKTMTIEDPHTNTRYRVKIDIESAELNDIPLEFRQNNSPFPRAMTIFPEQYSGGRARWMEETLCNEVCWKLAWLNPKVLVNRKNLLQRVLDVYRTKFMPSLQPRKNSPRTSPFAPPCTFHDTTDRRVVIVGAKTPLSAAALSAQNSLFSVENNAEKQGMNSPTLSCISGTTASLDFNDCFSLDEEDPSSPLDDMTDTVTPPLLFSPTTSSVDYANRSLSTSGYSTPSPSSSLYIGDDIESISLPPVIHGEVECTDRFGSALLPLNETQHELLVKMEEDVLSDYVFQSFDHSNFGC